MSTTQLTFTIDLDTAAIEDDPSGLRWILEEFARRTEEEFPGDYRLLDWRVLHDRNGNRVGETRVTQ